MIEVTGYLAGALIVAFSLLTVYVNTPSGAWREMIEEGKTKWKEIVKGEDASSYKSQGD